MKKMYEAAANAQKSDGGGAKGDDDIGGRKLHLERSPDPENVLWENMRMLGMPKTRACSQCTTKLVQVVLLVVLAAAAAFVSTFVIDGTDADLSVCDLHLKAAYHTDEDELQNTGCDYIQNELSWVRPRAGSADRKSFDSKCDAAYCADAPRATLIISAWAVPGYTWARGADPTPCDGGRPHDDARAVEGQHVYNCVPFRVLMWRPQLREAFEYRRHGRRRVAVGL